MDCISFSFKGIIPEATGRLIKNRVYNAGYSVKDIQRVLKLSCPQPIYRWFGGKVLPSLNHLYALSRLLNVHMEQLLVTELADRYDITGSEIDSIVSRIKRFSDFYLI